MPEPRFALVESQNTGTLHVARYEEPAQLALLTDGDQRAETLTLCGRDTTVAVWVWRLDLPLALVECGLCRRQARKGGLRGVDDGR